MASFKQNGKAVTPTQLANNLKVSINNIGMKGFKRLVESLYKSMTDIRRNTRKVLMSYFMNPLKVHKEINIGSYRGTKGILPNMTMPRPKHGQMLARILFDKLLVKKEIDLTKGKAKISIPYGIDSDGNSPRISRNGKTYARILNEWEERSRFNGYLEDISGAYRTNMLKQIEEKINELSSKNTSIYRY